MNEHPKFQCRREGHKPEVQVANTTEQTVAYMTICTRCGVTLYVSLPAGERSG